MIKNGTSVSRRITYSLLLLTLALIASPTLHADSEGLETTAEAQSHEGHGNHSDTLLL